MTVFGQNIPTTQHVEAPLFQQPKPGEFRYTRRVASRARSSLGFTAFMPVLAEGKGGSLGSNAHRAGADIVGFVEGGAIQAQYPDLSFGEHLNSFRAFRNRHSSLGDFISLDLGKIVAREVSDELGMIGAIVEDPSHLVKDREFIFRSMRTELGIQPQVDEPDDYYVDLASFHPDNTNGVTQAVQFAQKRMPTRLDVFDVQLLD